MITLNKKHFVIFMISVLASGIHSFEVNENQQEDEIVKWHNEVSERWHNALAIRDMILQEYLNGTLSHLDGSAHAKGITNINVGMGDSDKNPEPLSVSSFDGLRYEDWDALSRREAYLASKEKYELEYYIYQQMKVMGDRGWNGMCHDRSHDARDIFLNAKYSDTPAYQSLTMFHELAHAVDKCRQGHDSTLNCYTWLQADAQKVPEKNREKMELGEYQADKQGIAWFKQYKPEQVIELEQELEWLAVHGERTNLAYPSYVLMLAWLRELKESRVQLSIEEIKKLGLLW